MSPYTHSSLSLKDLTADDYYRLNYVHNVDFDRKELADYSANDLALELGHFFDQEAIMRFE